MCMDSNKCGIYFKHNQSFEVVDFEYVYMAYSVTDWERVRMLSERDSVKAVAIICLILGLISLIGGLTFLIIKYVKKNLKYK